MDVALRELETLLHRGTVEYSSKIQAMGRAEVRGDEDELDSLTDSVAQLLSDTMVLTDLHGRRRTFLEADRMPRGKAGARAPMLFRQQPVVPSMSFGEAVQDLLRREPRLKRSYKEVQEAYSKGHVFALAKRARGMTIERVREIQEAVAQGMKRGTSEEKMGQTLARIGRFAASYGRMVYRTNASTAYTAGKFQCAADPEVSEVMGAWEYQSVRHPETRPNHEAAHGLIAPVFHVLWHTFSTPMGFNCLCGLRSVGRGELKRRGLISPSGIVKVYRPAGFARAHPDEGFGGGRPDMDYYRGQRGR